MKKFVIYFVIILFIILFSIIFFKMFMSDTKYSNEDIYALIKKGVENMQDMQNVCIERKNQNGTVIKYSYKGNKIKMLVIEDPENSFISYIIVDLDKEKQYIVSDERKIMTVSKPITTSKGLQYEVFDKITSQADNLRRKIEYIKDEKIEGKDCIFVKERTYYRTDNGTFQADSETDEDIYAYWIEKSTGFVLGAAMIKPTQTDATPECWIRNITFNEVVDSDFDIDLPSDYEIIDKSST